MSESRCPHGIPKHWEPCLFCRIADLEKQLAVMTLKANASLANNLCPDHRDKQVGKPCLACEVKKLEKQLAERDAEIARMRDCECRECRLTRLRGY